MDLKTFQELLDGCGTDLSQWDDGDRKEAELLLGRSGHAREVFAAAQELERLLDRSMTADHAGDGLKARILEIPARHPRPGGASARAGAGWRRLVAWPWRIGVTAAAVAMLVGAYVGQSNPALFAFSIQSPAAAAQFDVASIAFGTGIDEDVLP